MCTLYRAIYKWMEREGAREGNARGSTVCGKERAARETETEIEIER